MLDPIPIIFVLTALVGIVVMVIRHLPELREINANPHPSWAENLSFKSLLAALGRWIGALFKQFYRAVKFAKSEVRNSRDVAKHVSQALRHKFEKKKELEEAAEEQAESENDFSAELTRAENLLEKGEYLAAEEIAITILKEDPAHRPAYEFLGEVYLVRKNWLEAVEIYRYLIKQQPTNDKYWRALGDGLVGLEDYPEAKKAYHKSLEMYPSPDVFVSLGLAYQAMGDYNSSTKAFESALDLEPENTQVLMLLANSFLNREEEDAASEVLEQILEIDPGNHVARERLMELKR